MTPRQDERGRERWRMCVHGRLRYQEKILNETQRRQEENRSDVDNEHAVLKLDS